MAPRKKKEKEHKPSPWESNYDQIVKDELEARGMVVPKTIKEQSTVLLDAMLSEIESKGEGNG